ncbi:MAG: FMN-binding protein [Treponema sp.]|jgi:major membrane immunogen (membrane-anchored lipoprotein)|nr:FMN-binding protein [Treponema sp.]
MILKKIPALVPVCPLLQAAGRRPAAGVGFFLCGLLFLAFTPGGCSGALVSGNGALVSTGNLLSNRIPDGYYVAEAAFFDSQGWKEYVSLYMVNGRIVTVEYNAKNSSGFIKSWDPDYMRLMNAVSKTYPNQYVRTYATALLDLQDPDKVDALSGATESHRTFTILAKAAIAQAKTGNKRTALVDIHLDGRREE